MALKPAIKQSADELTSNAELNEDPHLLTSDRPNSNNSLRPGEIRIEKVVKRFRKRAANQNYTTIKTILLRGKNKSLDGDNFTVLDELSLTIEPGQAVAIIGRNGSGKSSLLKLISGIYHPDSGSVRSKGRISALIELGAGFHPDFTGRENIYLGGVMYGLSKKEISNRFDDIVKYAELEHCIDDPVRTYSSGMYMRLGFSLAVHTDPDILIIDEVLAVGDAAFTHRCHDKISDFKRQGKTLLLVTHDLSAATRWCDHLVWLEKGKIRAQGSPRKISDDYLQAIHNEEEARLEVENQALENKLESTDSLAIPETINLDKQPENIAESQDPNRWGNGDVEISQIRLINQENQVVWSFSAEDELTIEVRYEIKKPLKDLVLGVGLVRIDGTNILGNNSLIDEQEVPLPQPDCILPVAGTYRYKIPRLGLVEDTYYVDAAAHAVDGLTYDYHHRLHKFVVRNQKPAVGIIAPEHSWSFEPDYSADYVNFSQTPQVKL